MSDVECEDLVAVKCLFIGGVGDLIIFPVLR